MAGEKVIDRMKAHMAKGETFYSFEFFPPRTPDVSIYVTSRRAGGKYGGMCSCRSWRHACVRPP